MIFLLKILLYFIEVLLFSVFIAYFFDLKNKSRFISISVLINLFLILLGSTEGTLGIIFGFLTCVVIMLLLIRQKKIITFPVLFMPLIYYLCIILSETISIWVITGTYSIDIYYLQLSDLATIYVSLLSKLLQFCFTLALYQLKRYNITLLLKRWWIIIVAEILYIIMIRLCLYILNIKFSENNLMFILLVLLIITNIIFIVFIHKTNQNNEQKRLNEKENQQLKIKAQNHAIIEHTKRETEYLNHRMFYILWQIEKYLETNDIDQIKMITSKYKKILSKKKIMINTNNDVFDNLISTLLSRFIENDIDLKYSISIEKNEFYNNVDFINDIIDIINIFFVDNSFVNLNITEVNGFLLIIIITNSSKFKRNDFDKIKELFYSKYNSKCNILHIEDIIEIKLSIPIHNL